MNIEAFHQPSVFALSMTEWQFIVGCLLGAGVGITLSRSGVMLTNSKTRWLFISLMVGFASLWGIVSSYLNG
jgi:F0F1-type ATP synthase assembly protein I